MKIEVKIPSVGESVREALLAEWYKRNGDLVKKDEVLFVIETDKVTLEIAAEADGILRILVPAGQTVAVGAVVGSIETEAGAGKEGPGAPSAPPAAGQPAEATSQVSAPTSPSVQKLASDRGVDLFHIKGTGPAGQITKGDVLLYLERDLQLAGGEGAEPVRLDQPHAPAGRAAGVSGAAGSPGVVGIPGTMPMVAEAPATRPATPSGQAVQRVESAVGEVVTRKPMSRIRQRIAERLLEAKQSTAMLTTFNEVDMSRVQALRAGFKDEFRKKHGTSLGFMSFFIKACIAGLREFPEVNAFIDGKDILYHEYYHIGIAIGAERGLVVPVIRHADLLSFAGLERAIVDFVNKIKENRLDISDLEGGTFTITNGGVYGSLMSTPILNPPQSAILGMHKIEDRPVVVGGQIVVRPMMYVAMSYDHRLIDGKDAVNFLKRIKEYVENPERLMLEI